MLRIIKFGASYCAPCRVITTILEELKSRFNIVEYDTDEVSAEILQRYNIKNIPTLIIEKDDKEVWRYIGSISKDNLEKEIKKYEAN